LLTCYIRFSEGSGQCWDHIPFNSKVSQPPLQMCLDTFVCIFTTFSLPFSYIRMLRESSTVFIDANNGPNNPSSGNESKSSLSVASDLRIDYKATGFMIQNSFTSSTQFSVALSYDPTRRLTSALVHSLSQNEINNLIKDLVAHQEDIALPMLLPSLLLASRVASASTKVRDCHQQIVEIELETGIPTNWHPSKPCCSIHQRQSTGRNRYVSNARPGSWNKCMV
jgi:hypothetical protein